MVASWKVSLHSIVFAKMESLNYVAKNRVDWVLFNFDLCNEKRGLFHFHIWKNLPLVRPQAGLLLWSHFQHPHHSHPLLSNSAWRVLSDSAGLHHWKCNSDIFFQHCVHFRLLCSSVPDESSIILCMCMCLCVRCSGWYESVTSCYHMFNLKKIKWSLEKEQILH